MSRTSCVTIAVVLAALARVPVLSAAEAPRPPLCEAAAKGDKAAVERLIAGGANINAADMDDMMPLHWAAYNYHTGIVELLIAKGANVNALDGGGMTPLQLTTERAPGLVRLGKDLIELLRKHGAR